MTIKYVAFFSFTGIIILNPEKYLLENFLGRLGGLDSLLSSRWGVCVCDSYTLFI